ncbi:MAG TPA: hypothetical protein VNZ52_13105 [Candidatus Thermoplasmatota archaeon]|nr:hypothetical protein [Candidatus Thermoplasmatota archaeon]
MTSFLITEWFGTFRLENGRVTNQLLFPRDPRALAEKLKAMQDGEVLPEERELAGEGPITVCEERLLALPGARSARDMPVPAAPRGQDYNFPVTLLHDAAVALGKLAVKEASGGRDKHVVMAVETIDDLLEASNLLTERLREWYALHAPEIVDKVERPEELAALVSAHGTREAILKARPDLPAGDSMGAPLSEDDLASLRAFARSVSHLYGSKAEIEKYLDKALLP